MRINNTTIQSIDTTNLTKKDFLEIAKVEKDMWAYGIGEYVKCTNCGKIHSKNDIFGHLSGKIKTESVSKLEKIILGDSIKCKKCLSNTEFIYDINQNIDNIKDRLYKSHKSYMTILRNDEDGEIKGFLDGYIDNFSNIFKREFNSHYELMGEEYVKQFIEKEIGYKLPKELFSFSSMGTDEKYKNFYIIFNMIQNFFLSIPDEHNNILGITELDSGKSLNAIYNSMGAKKIGIGADMLISNKNKNYNSDLFYHEKVILDYKNNFSLPIRSFIKKYKNNMKKILVD